MKAEVSIDLRELLEQAWKNTNTFQEERDLLDMCSDFIARHGEASGNTYYTVKTMDECVQLLRDWKDKDDDDDE